MSEHDRSFFDVVMAQRACRDFAADPVPESDIERMLEAAIHAPSAENTQPWVFVVLTDPEPRARLAAIIERAWTTGGVREHAQRTHSTTLYAAVRQGFEGGFARAPVVVVVGHDATRYDPGLAPSSIFPAVQNLCLAAGALGYGSALTTLPTYYAGELREISGLPDHVVPMAVVPIGRPARPQGRPRRERFGTKAHRDRFGNGW